MLPRNWARNRRRYVTTRMRTPCLVWIRGEIAYILFPIIHRTLDEYLPIVIVIRLLVRVIRLRLIL